jgi:hypothetical protein
MANETIAGLQNALGIGAHVNKFRVQFSSPSADTNLLVSTDELYLVKAASYPEKSVGVIKVSKQG